MWFSVNSPAFTVLIHASHSNRTQWTEPKEAPQQLQNIQSLWVSWCHFHNKEFNRAFIANEGLHLQAWTTLPYVKIPLWTLDYTANERESYFLQCICHVPLYVAKQLLHRNRVVTSNWSERSIQSSTLWGFPRPEAILYTEDTWYKGTGNTSQLYFNIIID